MKTITATEANRRFSSLLRDVSKGEAYTVLSRGKPVATVRPVQSDDIIHFSAKKRLLSRLKQNPATGIRNWSRNDLYDQ
ncbi:MAG: type II toxin-antitoxin system prevent-host-death family antitoxin [Spirochaetes bacterium]|nr:MAG: type II toxin-antitoxin system prevent-host-death family antitoxin [Spirochaetota bacterium]